MFFSFNIITIMYIHNTKEKIDEIIKLLDLVAPDFSAARHCTMYDLYNICSYFFSKPGSFLALCYKGNIIRTFLLATGTFCFALFLPNNTRSA